MKHRRRLAGPRRGRPLVHCLWLTKGTLGVFVRSEKTSRRHYDHTDLGDVIVAPGEKAKGRPR